MKKCLIVGLICIALSVGTVLTYSAFSHKVTKTGSIATAQIGYCETNDITNLGECLIRNDAQTDLESALLTIDERSKSLDTDHVASVEPINLYITTQTEYNYSLTDSSSMDSSNREIYTYTIEDEMLFSSDTESDNITFNNETGYYSYKNSLSGGVEDIITTEEDIANGRYKYTCLNNTTNGNCTTIYIIYSYTAVDNSYYFKSGIRYGMKPVGTSQSNPGLYKVEDEYTKDTDNDGVADSNFSYMYRGDVNNNWIEYAGALWRVVRINGNGSVRMIYSGLVDSNHTGGSANIKSSAYNTNYQGATYLGYMYNPQMVLTTSPNIKLKSEDETSTYNLNNLPRYASAGSAYYFDSSSFDINTNCNDDTQTCTMTCTNFNSDTGVGDNCIYDSWSNIVSDTNNYDKDHVDSTSYFYKYLNDYKYTCWKTGTESVDGSTVTVTCQNVSEIMGVLVTGSGIQTSQAKVRHHGYFSASKEEADKNVEDSTIKKEVDTWYENNILNQVDSNGDLLSDYLSDEIFCGDRSISPTAKNGNGYNFDSATTTAYTGTYRTGTSVMSPSLVCPNQNDSYTVSNTSGNSALTYPIGLITIDEVVLAGAYSGQMNYMYYLYTGSRYWTMTPSMYHVDTTNSFGFLVHEAGYYISSQISTGIGIRPVVNLASNVLIVDGTGTEDEPYQVALQVKKTTLAEYVTQEVYTGVDGENDLYYHDGTGDYTNASLEAGDNSYRYAGADPDNYVCFGINASTCPEDNLYRIIGVFDGKVKLIKVKSYGNYYWSGSSTNTSNIWSSSTLNTDILNETYLNSFSLTWQEMIATTSWKVGGASYAYLRNETPQIAYNYEVGTNSSSTTYNAKIGLMYISDYYYGATNTFWTYPGYSNSETKQDYSAAKNSNWLFITSDEWTITRSSDFSEKALNIYSTGSVNAVDVGNLLYAVRPTFYLNSDVLYLKGTGTKIDPIIVS